LARAASAIYQHEQEREPWLDEQADRHPNPPFLRFERLAFASSELVGLRRRGERGLQCDRRPGS
jgi:hypothetical protein